MKVTQKDIGTQVKVKELSGTFEILGFNPSRTKIFLKPAHATSPRQYVEMSVDKLLYRLKPLSVAGGQR